MGVPDGPYFRMSFRGYVRQKGAAVEIDEAKIQAAERYDGKYVGYRAFRLPCSRQIPPTF